MSIVKLFWLQSWDFKHNDASSDTIRVVNDTYNSRPAIHSMIYYSANFSARNWLNKQSRRLKGLLGFQTNVLRWAGNMYSFKQFRSSLNVLPKVVRKKQFAGKCAAAPFLVVLSSYLKRFFPRTKNFVILILYFV